MPLLPCLSYPTTRYVYSVFDSNTDWIDYAGDVETEDAGAKEVVIKTGYLMTLNLDGGTGNTEVGIYSEGSVITLPTESNYSKEGYELVGWKHSNGTVYELGASFTVSAESTAIQSGPPWTQSSGLLSKALKLSRSFPSILISSTITLYKPLDFAV